VIGLRPRQGGRLSEEWKWTFNFSGLKTGHIVWAGTPPVGTLLVLPIRRGLGRAGLLRLASPQLQFQVAGGHHECEMLFVPPGRDGVDNARWQFDEGAAEREPTLDNFEMSVAVREAKSTPSESAAFLPPHPRCNVLGLPLEGAALSAITREYFVALPIYKTSIPV
jgi:hypothetical protein